MYLMSFVCSYSFRISCFVSVSYSGAFMKCFISPSFSTNIVFRLLYTLNIYIHRNADKFSSSEIYCFCRSTQEPYQFTETISPQVLTNHPGPEIASCCNDFMDICYGDGSTAPASNYLLSGDVSILSHK